jgi:DNA (cytosine-5)-methyltransferase 1
MALRSIELFAGGGGLALALGRACGARTVCYVEIEAFGAATLVANMAKGFLDQAPVWSDVVSFDGGPWRGSVDLIAGGFPCQDISLAGRGEGIDAGERSGLWREFARIIREVRPRYIFVENVAALTSRGLDRVLGDLAALGFNAEWCVFRASDVGSASPTRAALHLGPRQRHRRANSTRHTILRQ